MIKPQKGEVRKPTKTISGITPVAVMLPPRKCEHGMCIYCPNLNVPQSYTPKSPVVMRAKEVDYDPYKQVIGRIEAYKAMNHPTEKIELIIMGGTFLEYPEEFQHNFIKSLYDALNSKISKTLKVAQELNENSTNRCVALCVETRPDVCIKYIDRMREWGVTRVELGVQIIDDEIYDQIKRGHKVIDVINATKELKNAGFKIGYHIMPGLPGSNLQKDIKLFKKLFSNSNFKPDQLKLYPCQVMPSSVLEELYWEGKYKPYSREEIEKVLIEMLKLTPRYCRIMRVMREIPPEYIIAGTIRIDLRREIEKELRKKNSKLKEIRYREIGFAQQEKKEINLDLKLKITKYKASKGKEYFLEIINKDDILFGLLRLRLHNEKNLLKSGTENSYTFPPSTQHSSRVSKSGGNKQAIIREVHVYGQSLNLGEKVKGVSQHQGLGKWLIEEAEKITKENKISKLSIISGIGVREYYRKFGYNLENTYMVKKLN